MNSFEFGVILGYLCTIAVEDRRLHTLFVVFLETVILPVILPTYVNQGLKLTKVPNHVVDDSA